MEYKIPLQERIPLRGAFNFRDLGGYVTSDNRRVKRGLLFRSDELSRLTKADIGLFDSLKIKLLIDLRAPVEVSLRPDRVGSHNGLSVVTLPIRHEREGGFRLKQALLLLTGRSIFPDEAYMLDIYRNLVTGNVPAYSEVFRLLADPLNYPALIHCQGGKDRTGFAAALILHLLNVPPELIYSDYLLTNEYSADALRKLVRVIRFVTLFRVSPQMMRPIMEARREYLEEAFTLVEHLHGTTDRYLAETLGVSREKRATLRNILTEPL